MKSKNKLTRIILITARILGSISLLFLVFMVGAHLVGAILGEEPSGNGFQSTAEVLSFICFPVSIMIGLGLAWKWEGLGGIITVIGIICFHIIRPDLILNPMIDGLAFPGFLFLLYWILNRKNTDKTDTNNINEMP